jgi:hypothetical protein
LRKRFVSIPVWLTPVAAAEMDAAIARHLGDLAPAAKAAAQGLPET